MIETAIQNSAGELLLLRRSPNARHNPDMWEFAGGAMHLTPEFDQAITEGRLPELLAGPAFIDSLKATALRETDEEAGLAITLQPPPVEIEVRPMSGRSGATYAIFCWAASLAPQKDGTVRLNPEEHTAHAWERFDAALAYEDLTPQTRLAAISLHARGLLLDRAAE
jgi:8-oxo-dGTP pyrophosphatase MutT (NUDIX family)